MEKIIAIIFLLFSTVFAAQLQSITANYDISYAIFGKIGVADASLEIQDRKYHIFIKAQATGVAKLMSNRRVEIYESRGVVTQEGLLPLVFIMHTKKGKYFEEIHRYTFDHEKKTIFENRDLIKKKAKKHEEKYLDYYARNDILTLFFNLRFYVQRTYCLGKSCTLVAVGANEKDGKVDIIKRDKDLKVILHRRIFASRQGEMLVHLNKMGVCDYAQLKDVVFFGDVKAKATKIAYQK